MPDIFAFQLLTALFSTVAAKFRTISRKKILFLFLLLLTTWYLFSLPDLLFNDPACTVLEDKDGNLSGAKIAEDGQWRFPHNDSVPSKFTKCIVQFEDRHFFRHPGINPGALLRALKQNLQAGKIVSGGSTLTMQVIRLSRKGKARTILEKITEIILATRLELSESKERILSYYSSNAPFGGNVVGLDAAAWRYFGRESSRLSWAEAATLAVLPNAPSLIYPGKNHEKLMQKRNRLLDRLHEANEIDSVTCALSKAEPLPEKPFPLPQSAPHLLTRVSLEGKKGQRIKTTLDGQLQQTVSEIVSRYNKHLTANDVHNAAVLVIEVKTGNVLAYIGNTKMNNNNSHENDVDIITAPRSTGSIMKPFLYAAMIKEGELLPNTLIPDIPTEIAGYSPKNNDLHYDGAVPAYRALARSMNIPSVRMLQQFGLEKFCHFLPKLGLTTITKPAEHYGLSLILGGAEASLWDLCGVYLNMSRTLKHFRNNSGRYDAGDWKSPQFYPLQKQKPGADKSIKQAPFSPVLNAVSVWFTYQAMLQVNRPENESEWEMFSSSKKIAWKTGTSFGNRDAWAIGTTPDHVVGVWIGNASGEGRPGLTGISTAAPVMFEIFSHLQSSGWFEPPLDEMAQAVICSQSGHRALDICVPSDTLWIPEAGLKTSACPYHQLIHLDKNKKYRVNSNCYSVAEMKHEPWFILPPVQEWYYKSKSPNYHVLPAFAGDCEGRGVFHNMDLIYPKQGTRIAIPLTIEGKQGETIFEAAHRKPGTIIYWHLDDKYIGSTTNFHQVSVQPAPGTHILTLVDEQGESLARKFEVTGK